MYYDSAEEFGRLPGDAFNPFFASGGVQSRIECLAFTLS